MAIHHFYGATGGRIRYVSSRESNVSPPLGARPANIEQFYLQVGGTAAAVWDLVPPNLRRIPKSAWDRILWDGPIDSLLPCWWHYSVSGGNVVHVAWYEAANGPYVAAAPFLGSGSNPLFNGGTAMWKQLATLPVAEGAALPGGCVAVPGHQPPPFYGQFSAEPGLV